MLLIIGFMAIVMFLFEQLSAADPSAKTPSAITMTPTTSFLYSMAAMVFSVIFLTLYLGFLATLSVNHTTSHDPPILVRIGRIFFWRNIRFQIIFGLYWLALTTLIFSPIKFLFFRTTNLNDIPEWTLNVCRLIPFVILAKPLLLIPPIMICRNLMVLPAIKLMPGYSISEIKILPVIFIGGMLIVASITHLQSIMTPNTVIFNLTFAAKAIIAAAVTLLTGIIGIWFAAGKRFGALQDTSEEPPQPEEA